MMTLRQIRHFIAVAETGSISAAAQAVFISQSTLTLAIQQLEEEIGVSLFNRHAKGMSLTHQGHQFLRQAHLILATVDNAKRSLQQSTDQVAGHLTIGVTSLVAGYYLADLITRFQRAYPNVQVRVVEDERPYIEHLLVSGEIDVGVLILSNLEDRHALQTEVLTHSPHRLWLPARHPLLERDSISLADVAGEPLVIFPRQIAPSLYDAVLAYYHRHGASPQVVQEAIQMQTIVNLVSAGLGLAWVPRSVQLFQRPGVVYRRPGGARALPACETRLVWRADRVSPALERFLGFVRAAP